MQLIGTARCAVGTPQRGVLPDKFHEIGRQRTNPFMLAFDCEVLRVQSMSWQKQVAFELCGPSTLDEPQVKLFVRSVNLVAHNGMTK